MLLEKYTLLYVEDNVDMQSYMKSFLEDEVKEFYQAFDGTEGLELYQSKSPDIILTDINMPKMDGLEMSKQIKVLSPHYPIILLSAFQDVDTLKKALNIGIDGFISKPIDDINKLLILLEKISRSLQNEKDAQKLKLQEDNKKRLEYINAELDSKVKEKTKALENINQTLESRIKREVQANREKDKQMIHQSKLAQMGEMLSMIAHQWRQPLNAISATSQNLHIKTELGTISDEIILDETEYINNYSEHLSQTINDFRDFFQPDKKIIETTLTEIIGSVVNIIGTSLQHKNINLIQDLQSSSRLNTHSNEVKQVILNLIQNSKDVLFDKEPKDAFIKISTYEDENYCIVEVNDNGGGIPMMIYDLIFNPYFSTKDQKNGTGLGLYMSKTIIEQHCAGILSVHNNSKGAVFTIKLKKD
ncbi:MAG: response regulator [Campylobacterota bacterium]|nr:response regulator [Campylobacterota bacterium]